MKNIFKKLMIAVCAITSMFVFAGCANVKEDEKTIAKMYKEHLVYYDEDASEVFMELEKGTNKIQKMTIHTRSNETILEAMYPDSDVEEAFKMSANFVKQFKKTMVDDVSYCSWIKGDLKIDEENYTTDFVISYDFTDPTFILEDENTKNYLDKMGVIRGYYDENKKCLIYDLEKLKENVNEHWEYIEEDLTLDELHTRVEKLYSKK